MYKIKNENIDTNNEIHKSHVLICHNFFQTFNNYMEGNFGTMKEALSVDKFIQGLPGYIKDEYEDAFYLYCTLLDALKYGASTKDSVGMHILGDTFSFYYDDYKWCKNCDYAVRHSQSVRSIVLNKLERDNLLSSLLNTYFQEQIIDDMTCPQCKITNDGGTIIHATKCPTQLMIEISDYVASNKSEDGSQSREKCGTSDMTIDMMLHFMCEGECIEYILCGVFYLIQQDLVVSMKAITVQCIWILIQDHGLVWMMIQ